MVKLVHVVTRIPTKVEGLVSITYSVVVTRFPIGGHLWSKRPTYSVRSTLTYTLHLVLQGTGPHLYARASMTLWRNCGIVESALIKLMAVLPVFEILVDI